MADIKERIKNYLLHDAPLEPEDENGRAMFFAKLAANGDSGAKDVCDMFPEYPDLVIGVSFGDCSYFAANSFSSEEWTDIGSFTPEQIQALADFLGLTADHVPFKEKNFWADPDIGKYKDSMELDSGIVIVELTGEIDGYDVDADVKVTGDVRVIFRDQVYRSASRMPEELLKCYHDHKNPEETALSDGGEYETPYYCDMNNWLEQSIVIRDKDGKIVADDYQVTDFPEGGGTPDEWRNSLILDIAELLKETE